MGLLDNLLGDLLQESTGYRTHTLIRAVGAKNLLLMGGAAAAGAWAVEQMNKPQAGASVPPPPPTSGALPPLPVPPLPTAAVPAPPAEDLPPQVLFAVVRTMVAAALSDGEMHSQEKALIQKRLGESGFTDEQVRQIHQDLVIPAGPEDLATLASSPAEREMLFRAALIIILADENPTALEKTWLSKLGTALSLPEERQTALTSELARG